MEYLIIALKLIVGLSLLNVWLIQYNKPTRWRGGDAKTLSEEFQVYGLGKTMLYVVGFLKVGAALVLLLSTVTLYYLGYYASIVLIILLLGSIIMHIKIKDPLYKSFPAALFIIFCAIIAFI